MTPPHDDPPPLTDDEVAAIVRHEMPELIVHLRERSVIRDTARLHALHHDDPRHDVDGLHELADRHLTPLLLANPRHPATVAFTSFADGFPGRRAPLITKMAALRLLEVGSPTDHHLLVDGEGRTHPRRLL